MAQGITGMEVDRREIRTHFPHRTALAVKRLPGILAMSKHFTDTLVMCSAVGVRWTTSISEGN
jgi:hypothetical protein